jgi:hypothetical protein
MTKQRKRLWLAVLYTTLLVSVSALLTEQQETVAAPDPVDDDRTLLDVFGEVAKEYLTQQVVRLFLIFCERQCSDSVLLQYSHTHIYIIYFE